MICGREGVDACLTIWAPKELDEAVSAKTVNSKDRPMDSSFFRVVTRGTQYGSFIQGSVSFDVGLPKRERLISHPGIRNGTRRGRPRPQPFSQMPYPGTIPPRSSSGNNSSICFLLHDDANLQSQLRSWLRVAALAGLPG